MLTLILEHHQQKSKLTLVGFVICCQENGDGSTDSGKDHGNDNALFASKPRRG